LSFQKVVAWSYVVLFETGKISINFLKELPPVNQFGALLPHVRDLRTWISHNLALDKPADRKTLANALLWLRNTCGTTNPKSAEHWRKCNGALSSEITGTLESALLASDNLFSPEDGPRLVEELRKRLSGNWEAYLFDQYAAEAAKLLGYTAIDVVAFRKRYLSNWRSVVESADPARREELLRLRIEADMLTEMANALPLAAAQALARAKLNAGAELGAAMLLIRQAARNNRTNFAQILEQAFADANPPAAQHAI
jgi:hypothetical protein